MRGGKREGAGRKAGSITRANADLREAAQAYTTEALTTLATIMKDAEQPGPARVSAANSLLDRGHGKAVQPVQHELDLANLTEEQLGILAIALGAPPVLGQGDGRDSEAPIRH